MTTELSESIDPGQVLGQAMAFQRAKLVLAGLELGLFALLEGGPATTDEVRERLGLHPRGAADFLAALAGLGVIERDGSRYRNGPAARQWLTGRGESSLSGFLRVADQVMYPAWGRLAEALRTGQPQAGTFRAEDMFGQLYDRPETTQDLIAMAEDASRPLIPALVSGFPWEEHRSVVELAGCRGNVLAHVVAAHPHLEARVFDLPQLEPDFRAHMRTLGMQDGVQYTGGDFFVDPIPPADVLMIGHAPVDWAADERRAILRNTLPAVRPGGTLLVWDPMIADDDQLDNLIRSLNLQLMTPTGSGYRVDECVGWLREAGYDEVTHQPLGHAVTLVVARRRP
jgi:8-O-methyltransferase